MLAAPTTMPHVNQEIENVKSLKIAKDLALPLDFATETCAILAKRGKGKTYTGSVIAEELLAQGQHVVVIDPLDVWWGLRAGKDGKKSGGLDVIIFGGKHADLPLDESMGERVADLVIERRLSCVLVFDEWSKGAMRRFVTEFGERLYARNRDALHLMIDEADIFAAQRIQSGDERMFAAIDNLVRRGRSKGVGITLISQRAAVIHKDVLTQTEVLIAMGVVSKQDRSAIEDWLEENAEGSVLKEILGSLAKLQVGDAWVYSPTLLGDLKRIHVRERHTFDSSATPKVGTRKTHAAATLADVDLAEIRASLTEVIERAQADDPKKLRARIQQLERDLAKRDRAPTAGAPAKTVTVVDHEAVQRHRAREAEWRAWANEVVEALNGASERAKGIDRAISRVPPTPAPFNAKAAPRAHAPAERPPPVAPARAPAAPVEPRPVEGLSKLQQRILDALAELDAVGVPQPVRAMLATFAGASVGGHFNNQVSNLHTQGLVSYAEGGRVSLAPEGRAAARPRADLLTADDLRARLPALLSDLQVRIMNALMEAYPGALTHEDLAQRVGANVGGHFNNQVSALHTRDFLEYTGGRERKAAAWIGHILEVSP